MVQKRNFRIKSKCDPYLKIASEVFPNCVNKNSTDDKYSLFERIDLQFLFLQCLNTTQLHKRVKPNSFMNC